MEQAETMAGATAPASLKQKVFVGIPTMDKKTFVTCTQSLMNAVQVLLAMGTQFEFKFEAGLPYVSMARNNLVASFMATDCTDMIMLDADLGFPPAAFRDLILAEEEVISGAYPKKQAEEGYAVMLKTDSEHHPIMENGVLLAEGCATGFIKIKRSVIERLYEAHPELAYVDALTSKKTYDLFGTFVKDGRWYGDDYGFCYHWQNLGGKCWVLPDITFLHTGTKNFEGNLHEFMKKQPKFITQGA